jgi:predicted Zn finger-like uncharacterized protein
MASSRLTCPECNAVLKPAQPVPDGKRVKCPKCSSTFVAPGAAPEVLELTEEGESAPKPKPKVKVVPAKATKAAPAKPAAKKKPAPSKTDDDEEAGTYAVIKEPDNDEDKPEIDYAPDMSIKDLRGPAQGMVVAPSNQMTLIGAIGCLINLVFVLYCVWPFMFSEYILNHEEVLEEYYTGSTKKEHKDRLKSIPKDRKGLNDEEKRIMEDFEDEEIAWRVTCAIVFFVLMIYNGVIVVGAIKMQNLESRAWGLVAAVMCIIPLCGWAPLLTGWWLIVLVFRAYSAAATFDFWDMLNLIRFFLTISIPFYPLFVGIWSLRTLLRQEVIDGFEYRAE